MTIFAIDSFLLHRFVIVGFVVLLQHQIEAAALGEPCGGNTNVNCDDGSSCYTGFNNNNCDVDCDDSNCDGICVQVEGSICGGPHNIACVDNLPNVALK